MVSYQRMMESRISVAQLKLFKFAEPKTETEQWTSTKETKRANVFQFSMKPFRHIGKEASSSSSIFDEFQEGCIQTPNIVRHIGFIDYLTAL